jgi:hypothetical protein
MAIRVKASKIHWNYFLAIENDVSRIARYIEFQPDNFSTYSIELARVLLAASSEIDVIAKLVCQQCDPDALPKNINDYARIILETRPDFIKLTAVIPRFGITLQPWISWTAKNSPEWWKAYNGVKHERDLRFRDASLGHCLNSVAALFLLTSFHYACMYGYTLKDDHQRKSLRIRLQPESELFRLRSTLGDFDDEHPE